MKKHVPVTDMTFGQLYDAVAGGGKFYAEGDEIYIGSISGLLETNAYNPEGVSSKYKAGLITRQLLWTEQLDGTWENGAWCMVWDKTEEPSFQKVLSFDGTSYPCETKRDCYANAIPLSDSLADQLETLSKGV